MQFYKKLDCLLGVIGGQYLSLPNLGRNLRDIPSQHRQDITKKRRDSD